MIPSLGLASGEGVPPDINLRNPKDFHQLHDTSFPSARVGLSGIKVVDWLGALGFDSLVFYAHDNVDVCLPERHNTILSLDGPPVK